MSRFKTISPVDDAVYVERDYASDKQIADAVYLHRKVIRVLH